MDDGSVSVLPSNEVEGPRSIVDLVLGSYSHDTIEMHRAIGRRLAEAKLNQPVDKVIADARSGESWAIELIQTVELPAPVNRLTMPEQDFGTGRVHAWAAGLIGRLAPTKKEHA